MKLKWKCTLISSLDDQITVSDYHDSLTHDRNGPPPFHPTLGLWWWLTFHPYFLCQHGQRALDELIKKHNFLKTSEQWHFLTKTPHEKRNYLPVGPNAALLHLSKYCCYRMAPGKVKLASAVSKNYLIPPNMRHCYVVMDSVSTRIMVWKSATSTSSVDCAGRVWQCTQGGPLVLTQPAEDIIKGKFLRRVLLHFADQSDMFLSGLLIHLNRITY